MAERSESRIPDRKQLEALVLACRADQSGAGSCVLWRDDVADGPAACLTVGIPDTRDSVQHDAVRPENPCPEVLRNRLIWWPRGMVTGRRIAIVSSRTGARHDQHAWWYDLLRTVVLRVDRAEECLVSVRGTASHEAVWRAAELFGIPRLNISTDDRCVDRQELVAWLNERLQGVCQPDPSAAAIEFSAEVSPVLSDVSHPEDSRPAASHPDRDAVLCSAGDRSYVLACRSGGHVHRLLTARLDSAAPLVLVARSSGTKSDCFDELVQGGGVPWLVDGVSEDEQHAAHQTTSGCAESSQLQARPKNAVLSDGPLERPEEWLCHWTRPCFGAWPGQSGTDYLDELLLGCETADRSALATLLRMVSQRQVLASLIRGPHHAVSFTEVPLTAFRQRRVYRRHRRRWDFEPWGIAVRRSSLQSMGARPVCYGGTDDPIAEEDAESVWFQPATDRSGKTDWTTEREWRLAEDLLLDRLPVSAICLFVDTAAEADIVRAQCSWPVVKLPPADGSAD